MENVSASMNYSMILSCSAVAWSVYFEQQYPTPSEDNGDPPPKLKRPVPKPRKRKPQRIIAGDDHLATYNQQPLDSHHLISNSSLSVHVAWTVNYCMDDVIITQFCIRCIAPAGPIVPIVCCTCCILLSSLNNQFRQIPHLSAAKWFESKLTSSQQGFHHQHRNADSTSTRVSDIDETCDSIILRLMWQY